MTLNPIAWFTASFSPFFPLFLFLLSFLVEGLVIQKELKIPLFVSLKNSLVMNVVSIIPAVPIIFFPSAQLPVGMRIHWTPSALHKFLVVIVLCYVVSILVESSVLQRTLKLDRILSLRTSFYANTIGYAIVVNLLMVLPSLFLRVRGF